MAPHDPAGERPTSPEPPDPGRAGVGVLEPGARVGGFVIVRLLGIGGMGAVYLADQPRPQRQVALKLVRPGLISDRALRRFELETEVLARLQHPAIARIYEAGMHDGSPYFAMEYVQGNSLRQYCEGRAVSERLRLFARVCDAVQHAHAKGVIHRDLKPANVLVEDGTNDEDGLPTPKVLDFGLARLTDADTNSISLATDIGQVVGTLPYMSPEQASGDPNDLDTRSDVYALGVILYEMLAGRLPHDLDDKLLHEALRIIKEDDPSRLSMFDHSLRGDIETIAAKALEKEKDRRYQSASDLASDVRRYLCDEPISARPASAWYQVRKFSKRHKALVGGFCAVFVALLLGLAGTTYGLVEANRQAELARSETDRANDLLSERDEALGESQQSAAELEQVAAFQAEQFDAIVPEVMGERLRESILEAASPDQRDELEGRLAGINFTGVGLQSLEENVFDPALEAIDAQFDDQPLVRARLLQSLALTMRNLGLLEGAIAPQELALSIRSASLGEDDPDTLASMNEMATLLQDQGAPERAERFFRACLESRRRVLGDDHTDTLDSVHNLGVLLEAQGRLDEAEEYYREALEGSRRVLGDTHPATLASMNSMSTLLQAQGKPSEAEPFAREALAGFRQTLGDEDPGTLILISNLGNLLEAQGRMDEAEPLLREVLDTRRRVLGDDHPHTLIAIHNMGYFLRRLGEPEEAAQLGEEAVRRATSSLGQDHWYVAIFSGQYARTLMALERFGDAEQQATASYQTFEQAFGPQHPRSTGAAELLVELYTDWHESDPDNGYDLKAEQWRAKLTEPEPTTSDG